MRSKTYDCDSRLLHLIFLSLSSQGQLVVISTHVLCICVQVSVDVFKGFPDEDSIVNYTLNQAYQDNVSVFASESFICDRF